MNARYFARPDSITARESWHKAFVFLKIPERGSASLYRPNGTWETVPMTLSKALEKVENGHLLELNQTDLATKHSLVSPFDDTRDVPKVTEGVW